MSRAAPEIDTMTVLEEIDVEIACHRAAIAALEALRARIGTSAAQPEPEGPGRGKLVTPAAAERYTALRSRLVEMLANGRRRAEDMRRELDLSRHEMSRALKHVWFDFDGKKWLLTPEGRSQLPAKVQSLGESG